MTTDEITPGERRELRALVRGQFKVLHAEVKRRKDELKDEIESELLRQYRAQDDAIGAARDRVAESVRECLRQVEAIGRELKMERPELVVKAGMSFGGPALDATDPHRTQEHRAAIAGIPSVIGDAALKLDRQELDILRELAAGALQTEQARAFLTKIPTVGELVPKVRFDAIEAQMRSDLS